ncbi:MAG: Rid family detoxifying hydrolase [bacterium]
MEIIRTDRAPAPGGHYSQAVVHAGTLYTAGLLPVDAETGEKVLGSVEEQAECVLANLEAILSAAGAGREDVLRCTVYVSDIGDWGAINEVYARFFGEHRPARTVVPTPGLHHGFALELEAVAAMG